MLKAAIKLIISLSLNLCLFLSKYFEQSWPINIKYDVDPRKVNPLNTSVFLKIASLQVDRFTL